MSVPVTYTYFCNTSSFAGTTFGELTTTQPPLQFTTWGWETGRIAPPAFYEMIWNFELSRLSSSTAPTASIPNQNVRGYGGGNCWIAGPFKGEFLAGNWYVTMSVKSVTTAASHTGHFVYRFWTSPTGSGENATLVSSTFFSSSVLTVASTTVPSTGTSSISLPNINLHDEYLLVHTQWRVVTAAGGGPGNNTADNDFVLGNATSSLFITTPFVTSQARLVTWNQNDKG